MLSDIYIDIHRDMRQFETFDANDNWPKVKTGSALSRKGQQPYFQRLLTQLVLWTNSSFLMLCCVQAKVRMGTCLYMLSIQDNNVVYRTRGLTWLTPRVLMSSLYILCLRHCSGETATGPSTECTEYTSKDNNNYSI